ncbi:hypothetical protein HNR44_003514 [Geomicrobium halophilum]|uniref:Uncharacterized protein n=1 Tax=Geomicrobium halophilum TaxID=549000 RepID=A0A841Q0V5_9BACL|nr:hypothetical protein [Geomicrobium halophilum]MBB6451503.1 hypothetical protein [Geomicrobium halophilum]
MFGLMLKDKEAAEMVYLLKKEMDEVYKDLQDRTVEDCVKRAMEEKYNLLFALYCRMVPPAERLPYHLSVINKKN